MLQPQRLCDPWLRLLEWQPIKSFLGETREIGSHSSYFHIFPSLLRYNYSRLYPYHHSSSRKRPYTYHIPIISFLYLSVISSYPYHSLSSLIWSDLFGQKDLLLIGSPLDPPKSHSARFMNYINYTISLWLSNDKSLINCMINDFISTSSTAQGGGGSFRIGNL